MIPYSVIRPLIRFKNMEVKFHTKILIPDENQKRNKFYMYKYEFTNKTYCSMDSKSHISINYINTDKNNNNAKDSKDSIYINEKNLYYLVLCMKQHRTKLYGNGVFYMEDKKLKIYAGDHKTNVFALGYDGRVQLDFTIEESINDGSLRESIVFMINDSSREVILTVNEFEALLFTLNKVDFFIYSQLIYNHIMSNIGKDKFIDKEIPEYVLGSNTNIYNYNRTDQEKNIDIPSNLPPKGRQMNPFELGGLSN